MQSTQTCIAVGSLAEALVPPSCQASCPPPIGGSTLLNDDSSVLDSSFAGNTPSYEVTGSAANLVPCGWAYSGSKVTMITTEPSKFVSSLTSSRDLLLSSGYWSRDIAMDCASSPVTSGVEISEDYSSEISYGNFGRRYYDFPDQYLTALSPAKSGGLAESPEASSGREPNMFFSTLEDGLELIEVPESSLCSDSDLSSHSATEPNDSSRESSESDSYEEDTTPKIETRHVRSKKAADVSPELAKLLYWSHKLHSCRTTKDKPANSKKKASPNIDLIKPHMRDFKCARSSRTRRATGQI